MSTERNVPKLRFPGFTEPWEQRKFSELVTIERGGSPRPIDKFITNDENGLNWVKIGDAPEQGNYITQTAEKIRPEGLSKTREVHPGDLILSNSMSFGRPYIMAIDGCIHDGWLAIRDTKKNFDLKFLCTLLGTDGMLNQYKAMAAGSTVNNLNKELVGGTTVAFPMVEEQIKIGDYFTTLDHLITLHQRKLKHVKDLKKSMLQKMFPKNGQEYPELRFPGFTEPWEKRKLGDVCQITMGQSPDGSTYSEEPSDYILVQGNADLKDGWVRPRIWTTQKTKTAQAGDLIMSVRAPAGAMGKTAYDVVLGRGVAGIKGNEYIYQSLVKMDSDGYWKKMAAGSTFESINSDVVKNAEILLPQDIEEQEKIGEYFSNLDHLITLHQRELEHFKLLKKGMLQQMFV